MKEFVISEAKAETAVLVGLITKEQDEAKTKEYLDELEFLADTAGAVTVKRFTQKVGGPSQTTYVGSGKLQEIKDYIKKCQDAYDDWLDAQDASLFAEGLLDESNAPQPVGMVIFDDELSAKQMRNIEKELQVKILDRTSLILDIFAMRAQTAEAKAQVDAVFDSAVPAFRKALRAASSPQQVTDAWLSLTATLKKVNFDIPDATPEAVRPQLRDYVIQRNNAVLPKLGEEMTARMNELTATD